MPTETANKNRINTLLPEAGHNPAILCTRARETIVSRFRTILRDEELTEQQWRVLRVLHSESPLIASELCTLTCIHKVSLTRIMRTLEDRALLTRSIRRADRRAADVALTAKGRRLMNRLTPAADRIYEEIIEDFGAEKYQRLTKLLSEFAALTTPNQNGGD